MKKKRIVVVTGTRAEYGLLRSVMDALETSGTCSLEVLVTGMHTLAAYGNTAREVRRSYTVARTIPIAPSDPMHRALGKEIIGIGDYLERRPPAAVIVLGDRDEALAGAVAAAHLRIPVAHIHGGDRSGYVIDDLIRHAITKFSHLHFVVCESSRRRVLQLGEEGWRVHTVGAPGFDEILGSSRLSRSVTATKLGIDAKRPWILVVHHPTISDPVPLKKQIEPLLQVLDTDFPDHEKVVVYPNADTGSEVFTRALEKYRAKRRFHLFKNLERSIFLSAFAHARAIVGNSSAGIVESGALKIPSLTIGGRQLARARGKNVHETGYAHDAVRAGLKKVLSASFAKTARRAASPYGKGGVGKKIVRLLVRLLAHPRLLSKEFIDK